MIATSAITTHKNTRAAYAYLREQGYDCVRKFWFKHQKCARVEKLPSGKARVIEGTPV